MSNAIKPKMENIPAGPSTTAPHPGEYLLDDFLAPRGISQKAFAGHIGVAPVVVNDICKGRRGLTPKLAMMIANALGTELQFWLNAQIAWEYARAVQRLKKTGELKAVKAIKPMKVLEPVSAE
jgi:addiction module HigA family antidote